MDWSKVPPLEPCPTHDELPEPDSDKLGQLCVQAWHNRES